MNAETKILSQSDDALWSRVVHDVNAWRGACLQCFSAAEAGVTETLLCLSTVPEKGAAVRLRHLTGQRFDDIAAVLGTEGAFAAEGKAAFKAIDAFRAHERLRTFLAHGVAKIAVERTEKWIVVYRQVSIRARQAERTMLLIEKQKASRCSLIYGGKKATALLNSGKPAPSVGEIDAARIAYWK